MANPPRPSPVPTLLSLALGVYLSRFSAFLAISAAGMLAQLLPYAYVVVPLDLLARASGLLNLLAIAMGYFTWAAMLWAALAVLDRRSVDVVTAFKRGIPRSPYLFGAMLIGGLGIGAAALTIVGIPVAVYLMLRWSLMGPVAVNERQYVIDILRRSWRLVGDRKCHAALAFVLTWLFFALPMLAATALGAVTLIDWTALRQWVDVTNVSERSLPLREIGIPQALTIALMAATWLIATPLFTILTAVLYDDYRRLSDGRQAGRDQPAA